MRTAILLSTIVALLLGACTTNPTTGRRQFTTLSIEEEIALGAEAKPGVVSEFGGELAREDIKAYVSDIGRKLAATTAQDDPRMAELQWEFVVLDSDVINAFALPGGKIFISRGLLVKMTNEAQLAGVLGHEIGHVTARHTNERFSRTAATQVGLSVGAILLGGSGEAKLISDLAAQAAPIALMSYDRSQETESDILGVRYMTRLGYDPMGQVQVMEILAQASGGASPPEILSTHPDPGRRANDLRKIIADQYPHTQNSPQFTFKAAEFKSKVLNKLSLAFPHAGEPRRARADDVPAGAIGTLSSCDH